MDVNSLMDAMILERADQFEPGSVADVSKPRITMAAKITLKDLAVLSPIEDSSPRLKFSNAVRRLFRVQLRHTPVVDVLAAAHSVREMDLPVIAVVDVSHCCGHPAFSHDSMGLAEQRFAYKPDADAGRRCLYRRSQPGAAGADNKNVVFKCWIIGH